MRNDLLAARVTLDERLGGASDHLCWPQGYYDDDYREIAREAGFRHFYTCHPGANVSAADVQHDADRSINRLEVRDRVGRLDQSARPSRTQCLIRK